MGRKVYIVFSGSFPDEIEIEAVCTDYGRAVQIVNEAEPYLPRSGRTWIKTYELDETDSQSHLKTWWRITYTKLRDGTEKIEGSQILSIPAPIKVDYCRITNTKEAPDNTKGYKLFVHNIEAETKEKAIFLARRIIERHKSRM